MPINRFNRGKSVNRITGTLDIAENSISINNATDSYQGVNPRDGKRYNWKRIITSRTISVSGSTDGSTNPATISYNPNNTSNHRQIGAKTFDGRAVDILVVGGGGGGGCWVAGGGGAGGVIDIPAPAGAMSLSNTSYGITIGSGGGGSENPGNYGGMPNGSDGSPTTFNGLTALGGGKGASWDRPSAAGPGGSGGGGTSNSSPGVGTQPSQPGLSGTYGHGFPGGDDATVNTSHGSAGGGGAMERPGTGPTTGDAARHGGDGRKPDWMTPYYGDNGYFGGGGGGGNHGSGGIHNSDGGLGGGGDGKGNGGGPGAPGTNYTGGGGGGEGNTGGAQSQGGNGGGGVVIIGHYY